MLDKKNVWYINHYAGGPGLGRAYRPYLLAKELAQQGVNLEVITASFHHLTFKQQEYRDTPNEFVQGVNYKFLPVPSYQGNGLGRLKNSLAFAWRLLTFRKPEHKPEAIVYSSPHLFGIFSAWLLAKKYKAKLILEVRDIWPLSLVEIAGISAKHPIVILFKTIEKLAYKIVDHRVALLKGADKHFAKVSGKQKPFTWIPNGADLTLTGSDNLPAEIEQTFAKYQAEGYLILGYAGALGEPNAMAQFIHAMYQVKDEKVALLLIGDGPVKQELVNFVQTSGLTNVHFFAPVSKVEALTFIKQVDVSVIGWQNKSIYQFGISPNKIFDYMLCRKPVIHACSSPFDPIAEAGCGISIEAENVEAIVEAILEMMNKSVTQRNELGEKGYRYLCQEHDIAKLAEKYKKVFEQ